MDSVALNNSLSPVALTSSALSEFVLHEFRPVSIYQLFLLPELTCQSRQHLVVHLAVASFALVIICDEHASRQKEYGNAFSATRNSTLSN
jgi:hypothetical protein